MKQNNSPWLTQLHLDRSTARLDKDIYADVVVVGGGIAGVTTLYYLLTQTEKNIVLLEGRKIAHGATGHNAGQVVAEFEKPLGEIIREYGEEKAIEAYRSINNAWDLLYEIIEKTGMEIPLHEFIGHGGYSDIEQFISDIETEYLKQEYGLPMYGVIVSKESGWKKLLPERYQEVCIEMNEKEMNMLLCVQHSLYKGIIAQRKGVMNSALFTEKLAVWCLDKFKDRVGVYEHSFVHGLEFDAEEPKVLTNEGIVSCNEIVLCTNGFENFYVRGKDGITLDTKFHHMVEGTVGYMTGFISPRDEGFLANYYYPPGARRGSNPHDADPYLYITKRRFAKDEGVGSLLTVGGPEIHLEDREIYHHEYEVSERLHEESVLFVNNNLNMKNFEEKFFWHGLMGYTKTGLRAIGREPLEPRLLYNLGCNGIGILPSIMGAKKIAQHLNNEDILITVFDPQR